MLPSIIFAFLFFVLSTASNPGPVLYISLPKTVTWYSSSPGAWSNYRISTSTSDRLFISNLRTSSDFEMYFSEGSVCDGNGYNYIQGSSASSGFWLKTLPYYTYYVCLKHTTNYYSSISFDIEEVIVQKAYIGTTYSGFLQSSGGIGKFQNSAVFSIQNPMESIDLSFTLRNWAAFGSISYGFDFIPTQSNSTSKNSAISTSNYNENTRTYELQTSYPLNVKTLYVVCTNTYVTQLSYTFSAGKDASLSGMSISMIVIFSALCCCCSLMCCCAFFKSRHAHHNHFFFSSDLVTSSRVRMTGLGYSTLFFIMAFTTPIAFLIPGFLNPDFGTWFIVAGFSEFIVFMFLCGPSTFDFNMEHGSFTSTKRYFIFIPFSTTYLIQDILRFDFQEKKHALRMIMTKKDGCVIHLEPAHHKFQKNKRITFLNNLNSLLGVPPPSFGYGTPILHNPPTYGSNGYQVVPQFVQPNQGYVPPNQGYVPPTQGYVPPNQNQGYVPQTQNQGYVPPTQGYVPPNQNQGYVPQNPPPTNPYV